MKTLTWSLVLTIAIALVTTGCDNTPTAVPASKLPAGTATPAPASGTLPQPPANPQVQPPVVPYQNGLPPYSQSGVYPQQIYPQTMMQQPSLGMMALLTMLPAAAGMISRIPSASASGTTPPASSSLLKAEEDSSASGGGCSNSEELALNGSEE